MDIAKNFAKVTVSTTYDASATSIVLTTGHGAKLPTAPFNVVWWNSTDYADPSDDPNVEIVRVTAISTDTLTVTRGQEGISASTKNTASKTYKMLAGLTAKVINTDLANVPLNAPQGFLINGKLSVSVASNNLTVAIKTLAGADPSASDPVYCRIGNTVRSITAALSVTKNAGTNYFNSGSTELATNEIDYFAYLGYNATDGVVLGFARIPYGRTYGSFNTTNTNETYCAISTITTASSTDEYELVGRFNATLSATASFNWSIPATSIVINRPIFETRWLTYTPTLHGSGGSAGTFAATYGGKYKLSGNDFAIDITIKCTNVGSWSSAVQVKLPISTPSTLLTDIPLSGFVCANGANPATAGRGTPKLAASSSVIAFLTGVDSGVLTWGTFVVNDHVRVLHTIPLT
jgi:hypothetical protein